MKSARFATIAAVVVACALVVPAAAIAKGGGGNGGGGTTSPPAPAPPSYVQCDYSLDGQLPDGGVVFSNQVGQAGCLSVVARGNTVSLYHVELTPGWTYQSDSTSTGVRVTFTDTATGHQASARIEPGKTDIRG